MSTREIEVRLGTPLQLRCGAVLPNRIVKVGMSEQLADRKGQPTESHLTLYRRWAAGGAGLLITGNVMVDRHFVTEPYNVVVDEKTDRDALSRWAEAGRSGGAAMWMELGHPGRQALRTTTRTSVAPSAVKTQYGMFLAKPRALEASDIVELIRRFAVAARIAEETGWSGVEIHAASSANSSRR